MVARCANCGNDHQGSALWCKDCATGRQKVGAGDGSTYITDDRARRYENDRLTRQLAEAQAEIERLTNRAEVAEYKQRIAVNEIQPMIIARAEKAEAELAALKGAMVKPLEFDETNNRPPTYDTGITKLGRWRVTYSDDCWMVIWGHAAIIARCNTQAEAVAAAQADYATRILSALTTALGWKDMALSSALAPLFLHAIGRAEKAMAQYPQPNYVISKVAEEAGEVVKEAIHCAEGRGDPANLVVEIEQCMAMLIRLYIEGDQVHGLAPSVGHYAALPLPPEEQECA